MQEKSKKGRGRLKKIFAHRLVIAITGIIVGVLTVTIANMIYQSVIVPIFAPSKHLHFSVSERKFSSFMGRYIAAPLILQDEKIESTWFIEVQAIHTGDEEITFKGQPQEAAHPGIELRFNEKAKILYVVIRIREADRKEDRMVIAVGEKFPPGSPISQPIPSTIKLDGDTVIVRLFRINLMKPGERFIFEILVGNYESKSIDMKTTGTDLKYSLSPQSQNL